MEAAYDTTVDKAGGGAARSQPARLQLLGLWQNNHVATDTVLTQLNSPALMLSVCFHTRVAWLGKATVPVIRGQQKNVNEL